MQSAASHNRRLVSSKSRNHRLGKQILIFVSLFLLILFLFPKKQTLVLAKSPTDSPTIEEAIEEIIFYSSYLYQTLSESKLKQVSADFFVPTAYQNVSIIWSEDSDYIQLADETETIYIQSGSAQIAVTVVRVTIIKLPNVFQGDQEFVLQAHFIDNDETGQSFYTGALIPVIPADFWGGATYTFVRYLALFLEGVLMTLSISLTGTIIGFVIALFVVIARIATIDSREPRFKNWLKRILSWLANAYVTLFRGTPMIVQASFFWYGLGLFGDPLLCGLFVVSLNTSAYIAEILRGSIQSIESGQEEAAKSVGLSHWQTMIFVLFPQAIKNSLPSIGNEFIINIKDTAVLSVIGIFELFNQTRRIAGMHYRQLEAYFVVAAVYLVLTYTISKLLKAVENKWNLPVKEIPSSN